jgi:hypothetical protein
MSKLIPKNIIIVDSITGEPARVEDNGGLAVNVQDQASQPFDLFFAQDVGAPTTLTIDATQDAYTLSVTTGHGLVAEDHIIMRDPVLQLGYTGQVVSVAGDNTVNVDVALNGAYTSAATVVQQVTNDLNVDGSGTRQTFVIGSPLTGQLDITRFLFQMTTTGVPEFDQFGDQTALTAGVSMRIVKGDDRFNLWNIKSNAEMANLMYDLTIYDADLPFNVNGLVGRMTYAGQEKHGVVLRLSGGEFIECIIQDDIDALLSFKIIACGHLVVPVIS